MDYYTAVSGMVISDGALYVVLRDPGENIIFRAVKFDLQTNRPVWQKDIITDDLFYSHYRKDFALFFQKGILIACNNDLYYLDANTGEILCQRTAPSVITSMTFVSDREFGFSLDNGSYGIGWTIHPDTIALTTDPDRQVYTTTKEHTDFRVWGGGIVQLDLDDDGFWLGVGNPVSSGYILLIPENAQNTLEIIRPVYPMAVMNHASVNLPEVGLRLNYNFSIQQAGAQLAMGPFYTSGNPNNLHCLLDPETLTVVNTFQSEKSYSSSELFWLPDTLLPLICNSYDGIFTVDTNGNQTLLYDPAATQEELGKEDEWLSSYAFFRCASEYLSDGKTLLTAACNPKTLQIWRNGVALSETDIPESLIIPAKETSGKKRMLMVGSNGWILTSLHDDYNEPIPAENIAAYNSQENTWTLLQSNAFFANEQVIAIAKSKPLMAGMDQAGDLQLLDLKTGNTLGHFSTQLSSGSVLQMQFFHDDTYLAINATGGHLLIYEVATGKQVYRNQLSNLSSYTLQVFEDLKHGRLYLNCGSGSGLCLDMDTWTTLAQMDNFMYYHADTNRVYLSNSYGSTSPLSSGQVPDTAELVKLATDVLAENK